MDRIAKWKSLKLALANEEKGVHVNQEIESAMLMYIEQWEERGKADWLEKLKEESG